MGLKTCTCARGDRICPVHTPMAFGERRTIDVPAKAAREAIPRLLAEKDSLVRAFEVERGSLAAEIESLAERLREAKGRLLAALEVPAVWSEAERDGLAAAYDRATAKHGHYESLFAAAAFLLRHRARAALEGAPAPDAQED